MTKAVLFSKKMKQYKVCLSIAGSDPSGGAGIQADIKTFSALGCYGAAAITALTIQDTWQVYACLPVDAAYVYGQVIKVMEDLEPQAVKIGMIANKEIAQAIASALNTHPAPFVIFDPVLVSSSGHTLYAAEDYAVLKEELLPLCSLVTPNLPEADLLFPGLFGKGELVDGPPCDILVKGGHLDGRPVDCLYTKVGIFRFDGERIKTNNTHGTGCTLSSAIAALVARGYALPDAVKKAKIYLENALRAGSVVFAGHGYGAMNHFFDPLPLTAEEL